MTRVIRFLADRILTFTIGFAIGGIYCATLTAGGPALISLAKAVAQ